MEKYLCLQPFVALFNQINTNLVIFMLTEHSNFFQDFAFFSTAEKL